MSWDPSESAATTIIHCKNHEKKRQKRNPRKKRVQMKVHFRIHCKNHDKKSAPGAGGEEETVYIRSGMEEEEEDGDKDDADNACDCYDNEDGDDDDDDTHSDSENDNDEDEDDGQALGFGV